MADLRNRLFAERVATRNNDEPGRRTRAFHGHSGSLAVLGASERLHLLLGDSKALFERLVADPLHDGFRPTATHCYTVGLHMKG